MSIIIGFFLIGLDDAACELENPFGSDFNDLPLDEVTGGIRKNLIEIKKLKMDKKLVPGGGEMLSLAAAAAAASQVSRRAEGGMRHFHANAYMFESGGTRFRLWPHSVHASSLAPVVRRRPRCRQPTRGRSLPPFRRWPRLGRPPTRNPPRLLRRAAFWRVSKLHRRRKQRLPAGVQVGVESVVVNSTADIRCNAQFQACQSCATASRTLVLRCNCWMLWGRFDLLSLYTPTRRLTPFWLKYNFKHRPHCRLPDVWRLQQTSPADNNHSCCSQAPHQCQALSSKSARLAFGLAPIPTFGCIMVCLCNAPRSCSDAVPMGTLGGAAYVFFSRMTHM